MSDEPAKRVLFLGVTGAGKNQAMETLAQRLAAHGGSKWTTVVFEDSYLWNGDDPENEKQTFLDGSLQAQYLKWTTAWSDFEKYLDNNPEEHIFLSVHGCFVRGHYGVRSPLDPSRIARSFKPDLVVTFIADVYDMWWMTEGRAKGESVKGRPTLEQLIFARRHELIVGDQIALTGSVSRRQVRNLMLAVGHPTETLSHCIINPYTCKVAYLSFPISQPRDWEHRGDPEPRHMVSRFIKDATEKSYDNPKLMILCPLGIDEIPFTKILPDPEKDAKGEVLDRDLIFDRDKERWALEEFWPSTKRLALPTPIVGPSLPFREKQLRAACGSIMSDITWRDYRLVDQSDFLVVYNPIFYKRHKVAGSVRLEVLHAIRQNKMAYVFQEPEHDCVNYPAFEQLAGGNATMESGPTDNRISNKLEYNELLDVLTSESHMSFRR